MDFSDHRLIIHTLIRCKPAASQLKATLIPFFDALQFFLTLNSKVEMVDEEENESFHLLLTFEFILTWCKNKFTFHLCLIDVLLVWSWKIAPLSDKWYTRHIPKAIVNRIWSARRKTRWKKMPRKHRINWICVRWMRSNENYRLKSSIMTIIVTH